MTQNLDAMDDSGGQDHRRRCFIPEGLTKKVGLHSRRNEGTLCRQGEVQGEAPDRKDEFGKDKEKRYQVGKCLSTWIRRLLDSPSTATSEPSRNRPWWERLNHERLL